MHRTGLCRAPARCGFCPEGLRPPRCLHRCGAARYCPGTRSGEWEHGALPRPGATYRGVCRLCADRRRCRTAPNLRALSIASAYCRRCACRSDRLGDALEMELCFGFCVCPLRLRGHFLPAHCLPPGAYCRSARARARRYDAEQCFAAAAYRAAAALIFDVRLANSRGAQHARGHLPAVLLTLCRQIPERCGHPSAYLRPAPRRSYPHPAGALHRRSCLPPAQRRMRRLSGSPTEKLRVPRLPVRGRGLLCLVCFANCRRRDGSLHTDAAGQRRGAAGSAVLLYPERGGRVRVAELSPRALPVGAACTCIRSAALRRARFAFLTSAAARAAAAHDAALTRFRLRLQTDVRCLVSRICTAFLRLVDSRYFRDYFVSAIIK